MNSNNSSKTLNAVIGASIHIEGTISGDENLCIEGRVEGSIFMQNATVIIAKSGLVRADVYAKSIKVEGEVRGELRGNESVEVGDSGTVIGDIRSPRVILQDGCQFKGLIDMDYKESAASGLPERGTAGKKPPIPKPLPPNLPTSSSNNSAAPAASPRVSPRLSVPNLAKKNHRP